MTASINPFYIALLCLYGGALLATFWGYGRLLGRHTALLENLPGGFVGFLAINELLALPFMLFHWSFALFFPLFLAINGASFLYGCRSMIISFSAKRPAKHYISVFGVIAIVAIFINTFITQAYVKYDADDAYYVSAVQQSVDNPRLFSIDPATGNQAIRFPNVYRFEGWELTKAGLSKTFRLSPLELSHSLLPLVIVPLAFMAHWLVFRIFLKKEKATLALILLGIIFLFGGYSLYSQGTFLLTRSWQGKATLAAVIIPFLFYVFLRLYKEPKSNKPLMALLVVATASVALNPISIFLFSVAITIIALILFLRSKSLGVGIKTLITVSPLLAAGIGITWLEHQHKGLGASASSVATSGSFWWVAVKRFVGSTFYFYLLAIGIIAVYISKSKSKKMLTPLVIFSLILIGLAANPIASEYLFKYTGTTYWRFYWLVPMTTLLPIVIVLGIYKLCDLVKIAKAVYPLALTAVLVLILSGTWVFDRSNPLVSYDLSTKKLPPGVEGVLNYMSTQPDGNVVAASNVAAYYHTDKAPQQLFVSRQLYYREYCNVETNQSCRDKLKLFKETDIGVIYPKQTKKALSEQKVDYFIMSNVIPKSLRLKSYRAVYSNQDYTIFKTNTVNLQNRL